MFLTLIGDVHGCYYSMLALLEKIPKQENRIIFLGDLINKGPRSYEVYQFIRAGGYECLKGNHEFYCMFRNSSLYRNKWEEQGGKTTEKSIAQTLFLKSGKKIETVLYEMSEFFEHFPEYILLPTGYGKRLLLTHGGISTHWYRENQYHLQYCLEARQAVAKPYFFNKDVLAEIPHIVQIIGHQPKPYAPLRIGSNYLLDSGCVYQERRGMGYLSALMFDMNDETEPLLFRQPNID